MEPYYPAGYTQEEIAEMFGVKVNGPFIRPMPQQPKQPPFWPSGSFVRQVVQPYVLKKQVQQQQVPIPKKPSDSPTYAGGKGRKQISLSLPAEAVLAYKILADEFYELGEIPEPSVANYLRYSAHFLRYNYPRWIRAALAQSSAAKK